MKKLQGDSSETKNITCKTIFILFFRGSLSLRRGNWSIQIHWRPQKYSISTVNYSHVQAAKSNLVCVYRNKITRLNQYVFPMFVGKR